MPRGVSIAMKAIAGLLIPCLLCGAAQPPPADRPLAVSLIQLIANPGDYDGKVVRVIGYVRLEFEGNAVYLHEDDSKHAIHGNGLWLSVTDDIRTRSKEFDRKYVIIEGAFDAKMKGHKGLWSGSLREISRFDVWSERGGRD